MSKRWLPGEGTMAGEQARAPPEEDELLVELLEELLEPELLDELPAPDVLPVLDEVELDAVPEEEPVVPPE